VSGSPFGCASARGDPSPGFAILIALLPAERTGFVLLANLDFEAAFPQLNALKFELLDRLLRE